MPVPAVGDCGVVVSGALGLPDVGEGDTASVGVGSGSGEPLPPDRASAEGSGASPLLVASPGAGTARSPGPKSGAPETELAGRGGEFAGSSALFSVTPGMDIQGGAEPPPTSVPPSTTAQQAQVPARTQPTLRRRVRRGAAVPSCVTGGSGSGSGSRSIVGMTSVSASGASAVSTVSGAFVPAGSPLSPPRTAASAAIPATTRSSRPSRSLRSDASSWGCPPPRHRCLPGALPQPPRSVRPSRTTDNQLRR